MNENLLIIKLPDLDLNCSAQKILILKIQLLQLYQKLLSLYFIRMPCTVLKVFFNAIMHLHILIRSYYETTTKKQTYEEFITHIYTVRGVGFDFKLNNQEVDSLNVRKNSIMLDSM
ncbi:Hypothetical_protein [Hexamita inflata]|uniref:Hypothetical_protein n=1 Tax=Hexamita inflata TaxID=28002 RepID=A0AA86UAV9_9EUKA|nr:Hypothetical protein HINF_LOCUS31742 [Hexamita inflata]